LSTATAPMNVAGDIKGIHVLEKNLSSERFGGFWDAIVVDEEIKNSLLCQAVLNFTLRPKVSVEAIPLHGIILLVGLPGTGKTSLARGLASKLIGVLKGKKLTYIEVEPHSLASSAHGRTQRAVTDLFHHIAEYATAGPTFVLLDEVETIIADRTKLSLDANPVDVHRATDAALVQLDQLSSRQPNLLFVATSNFQRAIDAAFISRSDLVLTIPLPDKDACRTILEDALSEVAKAFSSMKGLLNSTALATIAEKAVGLDGRQIRKCVASACTFSKEVAANPGKMSLTDLEHAILRAKKERSIQ
jgi:SpoVK/Ycf46/Vps4 family AAA+-type ATPase